MALTSHPIRAGLLLIPGSTKIILARWFLLLLAGLPSWFLFSSKLNANVGKQLYFTEHFGPLPIIHLKRLFFAIG